MTKQQLIEDNIKLVYHVIHQHFPNLCKDEDITQAGMLGLCRAAELWEEERGAFSTFACYSIKGMICNELRARKKHSGILSLDFDVDNGEDGTVPFIEIVTGEKDVDYFNIDEFYTRLKPKEREVLDLKRQGLSSNAVAKQLGCTKQRINQIMRILRTKWRIFYGH